MKIGNSDPDGQKQSDAALEDMEDTITACGKQKGCQVSTLLATYKRLLKLAADDGMQAGDEEDDEIDPNDADPDHTGERGAMVADVPEAARAASLLDDKSHRFDSMVQYNPAVQAGIRRWLTDMRGPLIASYENYEYHAPVDVAVVRARRAARSVAVRDHGQGIQRQGARDLARRRRRSDAVHVRDRPPLRPRPRRHRLRHPLRPARRRGSQRRLSQRAHGPVEPQHRAGARRLQRR